MQQLLSKSILALFFTLLLVWEKYFPLRIQKKNLLPRLSENFFLALSTAAISLPVSILLYPKLPLSWGIIARLNLPYALHFILCLILLDLSLYFWHRLVHQSSFLWRFHLVHHLDVDMDASTALRFHFGEIFFSALYRCSIALLIGANLKMILVFESIILFLSLFQHANICLPIKIETILHWFIVTPRMHQNHHSRVLKELNSNFATNFSGWDRIFKTFSSFKDSHNLVIGIPKIERTDIISSLLTPFLKKLIRS